VEKYDGEKSDSVSFDLNPLKSVLKGRLGTKASSGDLEKANICCLFWK